MAINVAVALEDTIEIAVEVGGSTPPVYTMPIVECTQAQYDAMQTHDANTLYAIPEVTSWC